MKIEEKAEMMCEIRRRKVSDGYKRTGWHRLNERRGDYTPLNS